MRWVLGKEIILYHLITVQPANMKIYFCTLFLTYVLPSPQMVPLGSNEVKQINFHAGPSWHFIRIEIMIARASLQIVLCYISPSPSVVFPRVAKLLLVSANGSQT